MIPAIVRGVPATRTPRPDRLGSATRVLRMYCYLRERERSGDELRKILGVSQVTLGRDLAVLDSVGREMGRWHLESQDRRRVIVLVEDCHEKT